jgi:Fe-S-cluster containining protein
LTDIPGALSQYRALSLRLDDKFSEIQSRHPDKFVCRLGCHSCCKPALTVSRLEKESLKVFLEAKPELVETLRALEKENPHKGKRCNFLSSEGACLVYEARPLVCRSHGAPLQVRPLRSEDENLRMRDVCPLNFTELNIAQLPPDSVINLDTLNTLLALLTKMAFPKDESRTNLEVDALLRS